MTYKYRYLIYILVFWQIRKKSYENNEINKYGGNYMLNIVNRNSPFLTKSKKTSLFFDNAI